MGFRKAFREAVVSLLVLVFFLIAGESVSFGQATGSIVGSVSDPSAALMPGVTVTLTNSAIGIQRSAVTSETGAYGFSSLQAGEYDISADLAGFSKTIKHATVNAGSNVTVDFAMAVGDVAQVVDVAANVSTINLVDSKVDSVIEQSQIFSLPLNGRTAYEMAKLIPGVQVDSAPTRNAENRLNIAGTDYQQTRYTLEGIAIGGFGGGQGMNVSQDAVQEFQVSISNNDPSMAIGNGGAVNLVTRSGTNQLHGRYSMFFRDNQYSSFPGLARGIAKANPNNDPTIAALNDAQVNPPFFQRQYSGAVGGAIRKDKLFWFSSADFTRQTFSNSFIVSSDDLSAFNLIGTYPKKRLMQTHRVDWRKSEKHGFFGMFSRDWLDTRDRGTTSTPAVWPSFDSFKGASANVAMMGWTAVWSPKLVSDLRVAFSNYRFWRNPVPEADAEAKLYAPLFPTMGMVTVSGTNMIFGNESNTPGDIKALQPQVVSNFTYVQGSHTWKFGGGIIQARQQELQQSGWPFTATVFNPTQARQAGISIPSTFTTIGDLMQLPVNVVGLPLGTPSFYPDPVNGSNILWGPQVHLFVGDSYKVTPRLTMNFAVGWLYDPVFVPNRDLPRPKSIAQFFDGGNVGPPIIKKNLFSPRFGFAWDPLGGGKTVIRGGFGVYYSTAPGTDRLGRSLLAPLGTGYFSVPGSAMTNPKGQGTLAFSSATANRTAGIFRLADFVNLAPGIKSQLQQSIGANKDPSLTNYDFFKGSTVAIADPRTRPAQSLQSMLGVQRQLGADWLFDVTAIYNVNNYTQYSGDANRQFRPVSLGGPVLPAFGQVNISRTQGKSVYKGLLISARKRLSHRYQLTAAYTLSSMKTTAPVLFNLDDLRDNYGYDAANRRHVFNAGATIALPWGFDVAFINQMRSKPPFPVFLAGIDLNGDGTANDRLPGTSIFGGNVDFSPGDVRDAAAAFNQKYAGTRDARGTMIQPINLPANFKMGDTLISQDVRLTKKIKIRERFEVYLMAEAFNLFNIANLTYALSANSSSAAGNVYASGFGSPNARVGSGSGSEGPRAFQFAMRVVF